MATAFRITSALFTRLLGMIHLQIAACMAACLAIVVVVAVVVWHQQGIVIGHERSGVQAIAMALADQTEHIVESLGLIETRLADRQTSKPMLYMARRLTDQDGAFLGVILACLALVLVSILAKRRSRNQSRLEAINVALLVEAERCSCKQRERLAEQEKTRQFQVLEHIMDSISQGLMMFDRDFRLVVCNAAADVVFGLPAGTFRAE